MKHAVELWLLLMLSSCLYAQTQPDAADKIIDFPSTFFDKVRHQSSEMDKQLTKQSQQYLQRMASKEARLKRKLFKMDSAKAVAVFGGTEARYAALEQKLSSENVPSGTGMSGEYIPGLDSLRTGLSFLNQHQQLLSGSSIKFASINSSLSEVQQLQAKFNTAGEVQQFISQREQYLKSQLSQYGFGKELAAINQEAYYYQQQLAQFKSLLHDKDKMKQKAFSELNKIPAYQAFMQKNSYLGKLFGLPDDYGSAESVAGLQTKAMVKQMIAQLGGSAITGAGAGGSGSPSAGGGNPGQFVQQQLGSAQQQLTQLQGKITQLALPGGSSGNVVMPDFKPNGQKTKRFLQRVEYGVDFQTQKSNILVPTTSDIAMRLGYKLSDKNSVGLGISYKLGLGNGLNHIAFSNQGLGLRSYIDIKAKGSIWILGGFEYNYLQSFSKISEIKNLDLWQKSTLFGLSKKYKITQKRTGNLQLLFDALYQQHIPQSNPFLFRMGYLF